MTWSRRTNTDTIQQPNTDNIADTTTELDIHTKIVLALAEARKARHHRDCHCRMFQRVACNAADALWTRAMDREIDNMAQQQHT